MYLLGDVSFQDMPDSMPASPAVIVADSSSSLPGLAIVAGLGLAVWFFLRRGSKSKFFGRAFGDAPRRRRNPKRRARRRKNVLVWGG